MGAVIVGTGISVPADRFTNADLARVMDTSDEWIRSRTGVALRHYARPGVGSSELGALAVEAALADAGIAAADVDLVVSATMTPDMFAPGNAPLVQHRAGLGPIAAFEIRQQCGGFLYGLELAAAMLESGRATTAVVVGAEVHAGYLPFGPQTWKILRGEVDEAPDPEEYAIATAGRAWAVLFGDGAGAMVLRRGDDGTGFIDAELGSDGEHFDLIHVPGIGFSRQPYIDAAQLEAGLHVPHMNGMELFRHAVRAMPAACEAVLGRQGLSVDDVDVVIAHQANERIVSAVARALGLPAEKVPVNIDRYANTTAATLPILFHEQRHTDAVRPGGLVAFTAFGAGAHWGASLYRVPG